MKVYQEPGPIAVLMKVVDNDTGETSFKVLELSEESNGKRHSAEEWRDLTEEEKEKWGLE